MAMATTKRIKETREQREERRTAIGLNNPKHDWWAKRKSRGRWIGGRFLSAELLQRARRERIAMMETVTKLKWWQRIYIVLIIIFKRAWRKLFGATKKGK